MYRSHWSEEKLLALASSQKNQKKPNKIVSTIFYRKWRNQRPTSSWCCSVTLAASSGLCTPTAQRLKRSPGWPASALRASHQRWSRASTSTTQTGSSSAWSLPKPCPLAWTLSPSAAICGRLKNRGRLKNWIPSSSRWFASLEKKTDLWIWLLLKETVAPKLECRTQVSFSDKQSCDCYTLD